MIKNKIFFLIFCLQLSLLAYSQNYYGIYTFKIYNTYNKPVSNVKICLYNNDSVLQSINSRYDGCFTLDLKQQNLDSAYIIIFAPDKNQYYTEKLFLKDISFFKNYKLSSYNIILYNFMLFTQKEYIYYKKIPVVPKRQEETPAIRVY